jgi:DHA1 family multidrug/chloramphenicol efflux transport protein-like MFS transporter
MIFVTSIDQYLIARFIQGTSICFISTVGYVSIQEAFDEKESIRIMAALTSIVLLAPVIGPLAGAGLMNFLHWKLLFAIIGAMSLLAWALLIFNMPETVTSQGRGFRPGEVFSEFVRAFKQPVVLTGALALSFSNLPIITWVALSPVILIDDGGCRAAPMPGPRCLSLAALLLPASSWPVLSRIRPLPALSGALSRYS